VHDPDKKAWSPPKLARLEDPEEVWEHYKVRGTPEERARLRALLDLASPRAEPKRRRA
jgi:hypothetical protein